MISERCSVQHGAEHHRQPEDLGDLLAFDQVHQRFRVELAHDANRRADHDRRRAERVQLRRVEHRHHRREPVARLPARVERAGHRLQVDRHVGADDALREGRGAGGVEVAERVAVVDEALRLGRAASMASSPRVVQPLLGRCGTRLGQARRDDHVRHRRHLGDRVAHRRDQLGLHDDAPGAGVVEHVGDLVGCQPRLTGTQARPSLAQA